MVDAIFCRVWISSKHQGDHGYDAILDNEYEIFVTVI